MAEHDLSENQLIGSRIREARLSRRMSQADLAAKANISLPHISNIENGKASMKLESFIRIIEALQVSADSLLRPDVPEVRSLYQSEFDELLADCSPKELDSILKIVRELKSTIAKRDDTI
ncbi:helix-turn-helix domain-containing protein [bacterium 210820-DFI.6.52]|nr:helix-turn-helix domain-containing protein [bacterium 210820-DFI.6.52]